MKSVSMMAGMRQIDNISLPVEGGPYDFMGEKDA